MDGGKDVFMLREMLGSNVFAHKKRKPSSWPSLGGNSIDA